MKNPSTTIATKATPPTTPPMIAPVCVEWLFGFGPISGNPVPELDAELKVVLVVRGRNWLLEDAVLAAELLSAEVLEVESLLEM